MNPIAKYLKNLFASKRILGDDCNSKSLAKADALLQNLINEQKVPGIAITVLKEGQVLLQKGYGYADIDTKTPVDPQRTIFRIASVSKPIAATALAHMVAEGLIDLDTSFYEYIPYYPTKKWDFTIRQLASHTAGIRAYQGTEYGLNKSYSIKESIAIFKDDALLFEPGTNYLYTSFDWVLLSLAIQEVSGISFEKYVFKKVLQPLGMGNTIAPKFRTEDFDVSKKTATISTFYSRNRLGFRKAISVNNHFKLAGGGYLSTTEDIAKFGQAFLDKKVLDTTILNQFITSETINRKPIYYGLGWQVSEDKAGRQYYGHIGNGVGGYSNFFVYPKEKMVVALLTNCTNPNIQDELNAVIDAIQDIPALPAAGLWET